MSKLTTVCFLLIFLFFSCKKENRSNDSPDTTQFEITERESKEKSAIERVNQSKSFNKELLNGVWAEDKEGNALFYIEEDSIHYFEYENKAFPININIDTLLIKFDNYKFKGKILTLSNDSLIYEADSKIISLYKRVD